MMEMLADEMACARAMLLRYESVVTPMVSSANLPHQEIQGFDLALQMLKDLEHLSRIISDHLPENVAATRPVQSSGLKLERSRHRLSMLAGIEVPKKSPEPSDAVDLF
ncbi:MAG: hypothetical protein AAFP85_12635 [Pseudomonadota bacterium]